MPRIALVVAALVGLCSLVVPARGQVPIFSNPITDSNPSAANPFTAGQTTATNLTGIGIGRGSGITANSGGNRYNAANWSTSGFDSNDYFSITFAPVTGYSVEVSSFSLTSQRSGTGPNSFALRTSASGYTTNIPATINAGNGSEGPVDTISAEMVNLTAAGGFRLYGWGATGASGTYSVNQFAITGLVSNRWSGSTSGNLSDATNWLSGAAPSSSNGIQFEGSTNTSVTVDADTTVQGIRFASDAGTFTLSGPNSLTLGAAGNVVNHSTTTQTINASMVLGANQIFDARNGNLIFGGGISESGGVRNVTIRGGSTVTLAGTNSYTGTTAVNAGTLLVNGNNSAATGAVTVGGGASLGGSGTIGGATTVQSGGRIFGGDGINTGALTTGNVTVQNGGRLSVQLGTGTATSSLNTSAGVLNLDSGAIINPNGSFDGGGSRTLATLASGTGGLVVGGTAYDSDATIASYTHAGGSGLQAFGSLQLDVTGLSLTDGDQLILNRSGNSLVLVFTPVPEPASLLAVCGLVVGGVVAVRKLRRRG